MSIQLGSLTIPLILDNKAFINAINSTKTVATNFGKNVSSALSKINESPLGQITKGITGLDLSTIGLSTAVAFVAKTVSDSIKSFTDYADEIQDLSNVTGDTTENTSRLIQVANLYGISTDNLTTSLRKLATQGKTLNEDTLVGLATQYQALGTGEDRQLFLTQNLGRATSDYAEMLSQNTDQLKKQWDTVSEGLILTEKQIEAADQLKVSQTVMSNNWKQLGIALGEAFTPALNGSIRALNIYLTASELAKEKGSIMTLQIYKDAATQVDAQNRTAAATDKNTQSQAELQAQLEDTSRSYQTQISAMESIQSTINTYTKKQDDLNSGIQDTQNQIDILNSKKYLTDEQKTQLSDLKTQLGNLHDQIKTNADDQDANTAKVVADAVIQMMSGQNVTQQMFTDQEEMLVRAGVVSQKAANYAIAQYALQKTIVEAMNADVGTDVHNTLAGLEEVMGQGSDAILAWYNQFSGLPPIGIKATFTTDYYANYYNNYYTNGGGGGGGGSGSSTGGGGGSGGIPNTMNGGGSWYPDPNDPGWYTNSGGYYTQNPHYAGGTFEIPGGYGNEGFRLGNGGDTASPGEQLKIIPKGQGDLDSKEIIKAINNIKLNIDYHKLALAIRDNDLKASS